MDRGVKGEPAGKRARGVKIPWAKVESAKCKIGRAQDWPAFPPLRGYPRRTMKARHILLTLAVALTGLFCAARARAESAAPTLAIISRQRESAVGDLLFSRLAAGRDFRLAERAEFARIVQELALSSLARESSVRAGQLVGAEALLFVEPEKTLRHLRLVETQRGEIISDAVYPLDAPDLEAIGTATKAQLDGLARKLRTPTAKRMYVALGPLSAFGKNAVSAETPGTLATLVGVRLVQRDPLILVFAYLSGRSRESITKNNAPQIRQHLDAALACLAVSNPALHRAWLAKLPDDKSLAPLLAPVAQPAAANPDVPGGVLLTIPRRPSRRRGTSTASMRWPRAMCCGSRAKG